MKTCGLLGAVLLAASISGQTPAKSDSHEVAQFVTERANQVTWNPDGSFLGYLYQETTGHYSAIGLYDLVHRRGKTLLTPGPGEEFEEPVWLAGSPFEIATSSQKIKVSGKPFVRQTIWALDGNRLSVRKLWTEDFPEEHPARITIETSPSLTHAIITVSVFPDKAYYVITLGAQDIVLSSDIGAAIKNGQGFAGWTTEGTAFFGGGSSNDLTFGNNTANLVFSFQGLSDSAGQAVIIQGGNQSSMKLGDALVAKLTEPLTLTLTRARPDIPLGSEGLELMPTNGILRQVRFPGYWKDEEQPPVRTALVHLDHSLSFRQSVAGTRALWLTPNVKEPQTGILVSPQAEKAWLHPDGQTVAFTMNGVFFVKTVGH